MSVLSANVLTTTELGWDACILPSKDPVLKQPDHVPGSRQVIAMEKSPNHLLCFTRCYISGWLTPHLNLLPLQASTCSLVRSYSNVVAAGRLNGFTTEDFPANRVTSLTTLAII